VNYNGTLVRLEAASLANGTSTITPAVQITTDVLSLPELLAFDEAGSLWFAFGQGKIARFGQDQLTASGSKAPAVILSSADIGSANQVAFYPAPAALPLYSALE
jgi:hypothetical protein